MKTLKRLPRGILLVLITANFSCVEEVVNPAEKVEEVIKPIEKGGDFNLCTLYTLGDKDGFGLGLKVGDAYPGISAGTSLPVDHRDESDPIFTDIYPADLAEEPYTEVTFNYKIKNFHLNVSSAKLKMLTAGIQDGDTQVNGSDTDLKLYIDGIEVPEAFDKIDQFNLINGQWSDFVSFFEIEIPTNIFPNLSDGEIEVKIVILQLNPQSQSHDAFAIDYCDLEVCSASKVIQ